MNADAKTPPQTSESESLQVEPRKLYIEKVLQVILVQSQV